MPETTYLEAIQQAIFEEMDRDPAVVLIGEDVGVYGGAFKTSEGLLQRFGWERVIDTPISETRDHRRGGAAWVIVGLRPIVEMQFIDFIACCFNQAYEFRRRSRHYLWGAPAPIVVARAVRRRSSRRAISFGESGNVFRAYSGPEGGLSLDRRTMQGPV